MEANQQLIANIAELEKRLEATEQRAMQAEQQLAQTIEQQELVLRGGGLGFWDVDFRTGVTIINDRYAEIFGLPAETREISRQHWFSLLHPDDRDAVQRVGQSYRSRQLPEYEVEFRVVKSTGSIRWVISHGCGVEESDDGEIVRMVGTVLDITDKKLANTAFQNAEERSRLLLESVGEGIFGMDADGAFNFINPAALRMLGYRETELLGDVVHPIIHHSHADGSHYSMSDCSMLAACMRGEFSRSDSDVFWRKDGSSFPIEYSSVPVIKNGKIRGAVVVFRDISARKQAEIQLRQQEERLELAMRSANAGLWDWVPESDVYITNDIWSSMLDYERRDLDARTGDCLDRWMSLVHPEDLPNALRELQLHIAGDIDVFKAEMRMLTASGRWKWVLHIAQAVERGDNGQGSRLVGVQLDIDDEKALAREMLKAQEAAEAAIQAKSDFLANVSHEIRTPMNAIMGMNHLVLQTDLTDQQREYMSKSYSAAQSLLNIINDVLDYSTIESGKLQVDEIGFDLRGLFDKLAAQFQIKLKERGLKFAMTLGNNVPRRLQGDAVRLSQILVNLLNNAVKFTERGSVSVEVVSNTQSAQSVELQFAVRDTGIGMSSDIQARLFQSFSQADASSTRRYGGTGLGLIICKKLTEVLQGDIWLDSTEGQGTSVYFTLQFGIIEQSESETGGVELSAIDGVSLNSAVLNRAQGLARVDGNWRLYEDLLRRFVKDQAQAALQWSAAVEKLDYRLAERVAHTSKGLAATIGAPVLQKQAAALELACADKDKELISDIEPLYLNALKSVLAELEQFRPSSEKEYSDAAGALRVDRDDLLQILQDMRELACACDGDIEDFWSKYQGLLVAHLRDDTIAQLLGYLQDFDFDSLVELIDSTLQALSPQGGKIIEDLQRLSVLLMESDAEAVDVFDQLLPGLRHNLTPQVLMELNDAVLEFDFGRAHSAVQQAIEELGTNG